MTVITHNAISKVSENAIDCKDASSFPTLSRTSEKSTQTAKNNPIALIDWLEVRAGLNPDSFLKTVKDHGTYKNGTLALEVRDYGTKFFEYFAKVYHCGEKAAEIQWGDRIGKTQDCVIKIDNSIFYRAADLAGCLRELFALLNVNFGGHVTRLDLALDGVELGDLFKSYFSGQIRKKGRGEVTARYDQTAGEWTSAGTGNRAYKYLRYYNKTREIAKKAEKQYISDFHKANGLEGEVKRLEIELHWAYLKTLKGFNLWDLLEDGESILTLWKTATKNWFEFVENTADSNLSRAAIVWSITDLLGAVRTTFKRIYAKAMEGIYSAKIALKSLYKTGAIRGGQMVRAAMATILGEYKLYDWLDSRVERWAAEVENYALARNMTPDGEFLTNPFRQ